MNGLFHFFKILEVDQAVLCGIFGRIWQTLSGPVTAILIVTCFSPETQGYYYTFGSVLGLQVFVELGLGTVIIQFASHEWSRLNLTPTGEIAGDTKALSRLANLARIAVKWYLIGGTVTFLGLSIAGSLFFYQKSELDISWIAPWLTLSLLTGLNFLLIPLWSLLEGCNQVEDVYLFRLLDGILRAASLWAAISLDARLWSPFVSALAGSILATIFLYYRSRPFLKTIFLFSRNKCQFNWKLELMPMQWRIAISWISGYFVFLMFIPVLFQYHGPVIAGQMGITWALVTALSSICDAILKPKAPRFGILIAQEKYTQLDSLFWRLVVIVVAISLLGAFLIWSFVYCINEYNLVISKRLLPPLPTGLFLGATVLTTLSYPFAMYLRAHRKEPTMLLSIISAVLVCSSNLLLGKEYAATGMAAGYLGTNIIIAPAIIYIWFKCRKEWHGISNCNRRTV